MFSVEQFYKDADNGKAADTNGMCKYLKTFENVIIWGAGNLGTAVGRKLKDLGVSVSAYWDAHYEQIKERNGIPVIKTYTGNFEPEKTAVIFCIANVPVSPKLYRELIEMGWKNVIRGLMLLEGMICPFSNETQLDTGVCNSMSMCTVCSCERLSNIMKNQIMKKKEIGADDILSFDRIHFIVNNFCNLKCRHCFMYMNSYPAERKRNVSLDIMKRDIQIMFEAVDSFGVVNVFGGEPFLHLQISDIIREILKNKNFGSLIINTNGMALIKEEQLKGLEDKRIRLAFSNYLTVITEEQKKRFSRNVSFAEEHGITVGIQNELPTWNISSTLCRNTYSEEELKLYKNRCDVKFLYVHNGKIFPCAMCLSVNDLGVADYPTDYVDIEKCRNAQEVREKIKIMLDRPYYQSCSHCDQKTGSTTVAGEQGFDERYALPGI